MAYKNQSTSKKWVLLASSAIVYTIIRTIVGKKQANASVESQPELKNSIAIATKVDHSVSDILYVAIY